MRATWLIDADMIQNISSSQLRKAASIKEKIEALQSELAKIIGSTGSSATAAASTEAPRPKRQLSPEGRARIAAAQKRRWAKQKAASK